MEDKETSRSDFAGVMTSSGTDAETQAGAAEKTGEVSLAELAAPTMPWDFPGWGTAEKIDDLNVSTVEVSNLGSDLKGKLNVWFATAICGNDITSSCLYVTAIAVLFARQYAPIALGLVAAVLFLFRNIYAEVGTALPLNGGAYNVLLNTTTKFKASLAACLTMLSYTATAVLSADAAMSYLNTLIVHTSLHRLLPHFSVFSSTLIVLCLFALLAIYGIGESAIIALVIFLFHIATLVIFTVASVWVIHGNFGTLADNWHHPNPGGIAHAIFFGFAAAMLGISGFESSANFIEEQAPGVFPKTLRNMWGIVAFFNPVIAVLCLALMPIGIIVQHTDDLLAAVGHHVGGPLLGGLVSVDAVLVLSGAVLTSYVGVTGLIRRMSLDRCLPQFLLRENKWRHTNHWIILLFCGLCCSIMVITRGQIVTLAGVYTIAFLSVMCLFAVGNILLKVRRARLPRKVRASWPAVVIALGATLSALIGNILLNPAYVKVFSIYFIFALVAVSLMFARVTLLKVILLFSEAFLDRMQGVSREVREYVIRTVQQINSERVIFFTHEDNIALLNDVALYVLHNEQNKHLQVVHCYTNEAEIPPQLAADIHILDTIYPDLRIDLLLVKGSFGPQLIEHLSRRIDLAKNYMFIGTPSDRFPHQISELGGVRLIM